MWVRELVSGVTFYQPLGEDLMCEICGRKLVSHLKWGIIHGVAYCGCGAGYKCILRNSEDKVLDKPPVCLVDKVLLPKYREAWNTSKNDDEYCEKIEKINDHVDVK